MVDTFEYRSPDADIVLIQPVDEYELSSVKRRIAGGANSELFSTITPHQLRGQTGEGTFLEEKQQDFVGLFQQISSGMLK